MKQVLQDLTYGNTVIVEAPAPACSAGNVLIHTTTSLISAGTERMLVDFGKASLLDKARQQPEKVKMVLEKIRTDGLMATIDTVRSKLSQPLPLGYCNVGVVAEVGAEVRGFGIGDRVVSNGPHADIVSVSRNLCVKIPDSVDDETAAFTVLASIGLQGIRLAHPTLGEAFVVIGVGLIGLLTVQLLQAHGCRVLAVDFDEYKLSLAEQFGAEICCLKRGEDPVASGMVFSHGLGVDGVIVTASTRSNDPISQAARMCRKRGRIILVGVTGLELTRADFYEKELSFQVSCSYGPGRYDPNYEEKGQDYPYGFVRWTEQRNFEAVLVMMASGRLNVKPLISQRIAFEEAPKAYQLLTENHSVLGILLQYASKFSDRAVSHITLKSNTRFDMNKPIIGFIGAGNYASRILIPSFKNANANLHTIVTEGGIHGVIHGRKAGFVEASTNIEKLLKNDTVNTIVIATRHNIHAQLVVEALSFGKHVFVEKPLAIQEEELAEVIDAYHSAEVKGKKLHLMVGFNRRFAPHIQKMKVLLDSIPEPKSLIMTMNAGTIPVHHWTQDIEVGGGRIIGEACHYIDLMRFLIGSPIVSIQTRCIGSTPHAFVREDKATITLGFSDGSFGSIHYFANGSASFPKERIEVFAGGRVLQLHNFRKLQGFGWPNFKKMHLWKQDKGQNECVRQFLAAIDQGIDTPIPAEEIFEVAHATLEVAKMLKEQQNA